MKLYIYFLFESKYIYICNVSFKTQCLAPQIIIEKLCSCEVKSCISVQHGRSLMGLGSDCQLQETRTCRLEMHFLETKVILRNRHSRSSEIWHYIIIILFYYFKKLIQIPTSPPPTPLHSFHTPFSSPSPILRGKSTHVMCKCVGVCTCTQPFLR